MKKLDLFYIRDSHIEATMIEEIDGKTYQAIMTIPFVDNGDDTVTIKMSKEFMLDLIGQLNYAVM